MAGISLPTIQRMEASEGNVRGVVESLMRVIAALDRAGIELIAEGATSVEGGRGVRLKQLMPGLNASGSRREISGGPDGLD